MLGVANALFFVFLALHGGGLLHDWNAWVAVIWAFFAGGFLATRAHEGSKD